MTEDHRIAVDIQALQAWSSRGRGIGRYVHELVSALVSDHRRHIHSLLINPRFPVTPEVEDFLSSGLVREHSPTAPIDGTGATPGVYYTPSPLEWDFTLGEVWPVWVRARPIRTAATLHDLIPLIFPDQYLTRFKMHERYWARLELLRQVDLLLCNSESTARDARRLLDLPHENIVNVGAGISDDFTPPRDSPTPERSPIPEIPQIRRPYLLYTGGLDYRKNLTGMMRAFSLLPLPIRSTRQLVIVMRLTPEQQRALVDEAAAMGIADRVVFTGFVPDEVLRTLYQHAELFIFPSLYEGFGLPVGEAILSGTLTVASDNSSLVELVTDSALRFDPDDPADIAACIERALEESDTKRLEQHRHISGRFTWGAVADRTITAIGRLETHDSGEPKRAAGAPTRPRIAMFSPLPPDDSGIADYTRRLARALAEFVDVDLVSNTPERHRRLDALDGVDVIGVGGFHLRDVLRPYDDVVYVMGNSSYHGDIYDLMETRPGTVLLHEARFTDFLSWYHTDRKLGAAAFHRLVQSEYPHLDPSIGSGGLVDPEEADRRGIFLTGPIIDRATRVLTTNAHAAELAEKERPDRAGDIVDVGFGFPEPSTVERSDDGRWLATFGYQHRVKATDTVLGAFLLISDEFPGLRLAIVGSVDPELLVKLRSAVAEADKDSRVTMTGRIETGEYEMWLQRTTVALQLRRATNGELSAAAADCLSSGIPTVVTDIGSARGLPDSVVMKVPAAVEEEDLADTVRLLLEDPHRRAALSLSATAFAAEHSFSAAAKRLLAAIDCLPGRMP